MDSGVVRRLLGRYMFTTCKLPPTSQPASPKTVGLLEHRRRPPSLLDGPALVGARVAISVG